MLKMAFNQICTGFSAVSNPLTCLGVISATYMGTCETVYVEQITIYQKGLCLGIKQDKSI